MIDGTNTSLDWQKHPTDIIVLPVGAFEQHSNHLPLESDNIGAEYFARAIANDLDAALLPAVRIATSLEHTGFRGSFSLRPETLMQVVRDIAEEAERQSFHYMILVNGHGGNHVLPSVCRDINRRNRSLKIIIVDYWMFDGPGAAHNSGKGMDLHSGESETSILMAIAPDLVRADGRDMIPQTGSHPLVQGDLSTFGVGHFNPHGALGSPSLASAEKGHAAVKVCLANILSFVRNRIERLKRQPRYAGEGGLAIRRMVRSDIPAAMRLKTLAGWSQSEATWELLLDTDPDGCFVMVQDGRVVATTCVCNFRNQLAWIGMVLVDPEYRRMGIATRMMKHAMESLPACETFKLDATADGRLVYEKMGFTVCCGVERLCIDSYSQKADFYGQDISALETQDLPSVLEFDKVAFGVDRSEILSQFRKRFPEFGVKLVRNGKVAGYCLARTGSSAVQIGPLVAGSTVDACELTTAIMGQLKGRAAILDIMDNHADYRQFLIESGFRGFRSFVRMIRGADRFPGEPSNQFIIAGPELG